MDIELQYKHFYLRTGEYGCIPLRLINRGGKFVTHINLSVQCSAFCADKKQVMVDRQISLPAGSSSEFGECEGQVSTFAGQFPVHVRGNYTVGERTLAFRGRFTLIVRKRDEKGASIVVEDAGALMVDSIDAEAIDNIVVRDGGAAAISHLQQGPAGARGQWTTIHTDYDPATTRLLREYNTGFENIQFEPIRQSDRKTRAFLQIKTNGHQRTVQILTGRRWKLGRSGKGADVVTALLPATEENNIRSERISREHCILSLHNNNTITVEDSSSNGTSISGKPVNGSDSLTDGCRLSLAGVMNFYCQLFCDYSAINEVKTIKSRTQTIMDYSASLASLNVDALTAKAPLNCFSLHRSDGFQDKLSYLFLRRYVRLGSSFVCGIQIDDASIAGQHAQLIFQEQGFYLQDMGSSVTWLNGQSVAPRSLTHLPLGTEVNIRLGKVEIIFNATN